MRESLIDLTEFDLQPQSTDPRLTSAVRFSPNEEYLGALRSSQQFQLSLEGRIDAVAEIARFDLELLTRLGLSSRTNIEYCEARSYPSLAHPAEASFPLRPEASEKIHDALKDYITANCSGRH
jgi:hypothetical protein